VYPRFRIALHEKEIDLLKKVKEFFGFGNVVRKSQEALRGKGVRASDLIIFEVITLAGCNRVREFFQKNELKSSKREDFELWSKCIGLVISKRHLKTSGLLEIAKLRDQMNVTGKMRAVGKSQYRDYEWFKRKLVGNSTIEAGIVRKEELV
ncbi:LAGLIDADG family homing endonuclease, partial [Candidatus Bathyarchaeota archaeon]|nr:LAGLIDADG family homing endonuclease [Candidatus Bathyarchaeota archaeon]